ncbi:Zinc finger protein, partial [Armadillidium vulgare]
ELLRHQAIHDATTAFKCFCGVVFKTKTSFKYHQKKFHIPNIPLKCSICLKIYKDKWQLKNHTQSNHFPQCFRCTFTSCGKIFSTKALLHNHQMVHSKIRYECSICKKKFKLWRYKEIHEKSHNGFRPFKCKECDKTYLTLSHLNGHWKKEHLQISSV